MAEVESTHSIEFELNGEQRASGGARRASSWSTSSATTSG